MALYAFDGTWNRNHDDPGLYGQNTNVFKFTKAYKGRKAVYQKKGEEMHIVEDDDTAYFTGVGTKHGKLGEFIGGLTGAGGRNRIRAAIERVEKKFSEDDTDIDVIGFSRGAAIALDFANALHKHGAMRNSKGQKIAPQIRFLGLWDVVAAFGVPIDIGPLPFQSINLGHSLNLPKDFVKYAFHAMALDERRKAFRVTRLDGAYEVWFRGVHSDVGGGNENEKLSNIALAWMLRKAAAAKLPVDEKVADRIAFDHTAPIKPSDRLTEGHRPVIAKKDLVHHTVADRPDDPRCQTPKDCPVETAELEKTRLKL